MRRLWIGAAVVVVLLSAAGALAWSRPAFQDWLLLRGAGAQLRRSAAAFPAPDGIRVILCGTSPPPPSRMRAKSCAAVMVGERTFIVDTGPGSANNLSLWGFPMGRISGVLLTHFHSDHIGDLGEFRMLSWTAGRTAPLPVYGPDGVDKVVEGFNLAYHLDDDYLGDPSRPARGRRAAGRPPVRACGRRPARQAHVGRGRARRRRTQDHRVPGKPRAGLPGGGLQV